MTLKATPENLQGKPQPDFRKSDFDAAIYKYGYDIIIDKAVRCPCEGRDGNSLSDCQNCQGTGFMYINPISTVGLITGINRNSEQKSWSVELIGTLSLTIRDNIENIQEKPAFHDKVTLIKKRSDQAIPYGFHSEVLQIRDNGLGSKFAFLTYKPQEIIDVWYYTASNQALTRVTDFNIKVDNPYIVEFPSLPTVSNESITVRYKHYLQSIVIDLPHEVRFSTEVNKNGRLDTITLPTNAICRKVDIVQVERPDYDGSGIISNTYLT